MNAPLSPAACARARTERLGVAVALVVLAAWIATLVIGALALRAPVALVWVAPAVIALRTLAFTGLFITAHDAMHGLVAPSRPGLNRAVGVLALGLYAFLPYERLLRAHHAHHRAPARAGDPDWRDASFGRWFASFLFDYMSVGTLALNAATFVVLLLAGATVLELGVLWVLPAWLSALQLFFFGTYLPHRAGPDHTDDHRARSLDVGPALSFLSCFHFGYHWEHHEEPWAPWWMLPARRAAHARVAKAAVAR